MKYLRYLIFIFVTSFFFFFARKFISEPFWKYLQKTYNIHAGLLYTVGPYVLEMTVITIGFILSKWIFSKLKWDLSPFVSNIPTLPEPIQAETIIQGTKLTHSRLEARDGVTGKQYVVQLSEDELINFWTTLQELEQQLEKTVSFQFASSSDKSLSVHLIGGEKIKSKRIVENSLILLLIIGACVGVYLVLSEIWDLLSSV